MNHYETNLDKNDANYVPLTPLSFLERAKDIYPNYEAVVYESRKYTWSEVYKRCVKFASALDKIGIKTGDTVIVITGKDKGKTGKVTSVIKANDRVVVEGVNIIKRHKKATQESPGKIEEIESSIHISNVAHLDPETGKATRVKYDLNDGLKKRLSVVSGSLLDK